MRRRCRVSGSSTKRAAASAHAWSACSPWAAWWRRPTTNGRATRGDGLGTELLGDCYFHGQGRPQSYVRSAELYGQAGRLGVAVSFSALGNQYLNGLGVAQDEARGLALCRQGADAGSPDAQTDLGEFYLFGKHVPKDTAQAAGWFEKASAQGQSRAALLLGEQYWNGDGVPQDRQKAGKLWRAAAQASQPAAPAHLVQLYFLAAIRPAEHQVVQGPGVAAVYWAMVAEQRDPQPAARAKAQHLAALLLSVAPELRAPAQDLLANGRFPAD